ncbi:MAG: hypothetical protein AB1489_33250 [Acidobacteriota bacterium]
MKIPGSTNHHTQHAHTTHTHSTHLHKPDVAPLRKWPPPGQLTQKDIDSGEVGASRSSRASGSPMSSMSSGQPRRGVIVRLLGRLLGWVR